MRWFARLFGYASIGAVAIAVAATVVLHSVDVEDIENILSARVQAATGREVRISGTVDFDISLVPVIRAKGVSFANAAWGNQPDMLRIASVEVGLDLLALLRGQVKLSRVVLVEPEIVLERNADGARNWHFSDGVATRGDNSVELPILDRLRIERGRVTYRDEILAINRSADITAFDLQSAPDRGPMRVQLRGGFQDVPIAIRGKIGSLYRLVDDPRHYGASFEGRVLGTEFTSEISVERPLTLRNIDTLFTAKGMDASDFFEKARRLFSNLDVPVLPELGRFEVSGRILGTTDKIAVRDIVMTIASPPGTSIRATGKIDNLSVVQGVTLSLDVAGADIRELSSLAGVPFAKKLPYRAAFIFRRTPELLRFDNMDLQLGANRLKGNAAVSLPFMENRVQVAVGSGRLDVDELIGLLPKSNASVERISQDGAEFVIPDTPLPVTGLDGLALSIKFVGKNVDIDPFRLNSFNFWLRIDDGSLTLDPIDAKLADGRFSGSIEISGPSSAPTSKISGTVRGANVALLLKGFGVSDLVDGRVNADFDLTGRGGTIRAILGSSSGKAEVTGVDGQVTGRYLDFLATDLVTEILPWTKSTGDTKINCLVSRFDIADGVATSTGFLLDTDKLAVTGAGKINFSDETLSLRFDPRAKQPSLVSLSFPFDVGGTLGNPTAAPTPKSVLKGVAGLALGLVNPLALLLATASTGDDQENRCLAALKTRSVKVQEPARKKSEQASRPGSPGLANPLKGAGKIVEGVGSGIGGALKSIFGKDGK